MSCRHDLALGTCAECYPSTGTVFPGGSGTISLDGPGAQVRTLTELLDEMKTQLDQARIEVTHLRTTVDDLQHALAASLNTHPGNVMRGPGENTLEFRARMARKFALRKEGT